MSLIWNREYIINHSAHFYLIYFNACFCIFFFSHSTTYDKFQSIFFLLPSFLLTHLTVGIKVLHKLLVHVCCQFWALKALKQLLNFLRINDLSSLFNSYFKPTSGVCAQLLTLPSSMLQYLQSASSHLWVSAIIKDKHTLCCCVFPYYIW